MNVPPLKNSTPLGTSSDALSNNAFSIHANHEQSIELLNDMMRKIMDGKDCEPFIIATKDGKPLVQKLEVGEDGQLILPDIKIQSKYDLQIKSKAVRRILKNISPILKAEIENVTYVALMRKDSEKLKEIMANLKDKDVKIKVENRLGCIWLVIGDFEFVI